MRRTTAVSRLPALIQRWGCGTLVALHALAPGSVQAQTTEDNLPLPRQATLSIQPRASSFQTRWDRFEAEFGLPDQRTSLLTASLLRAKYGVDLAAFSLKTFANTLEDATELRFSRGRIRRASSAEISPSPRYSHPTGPFSLEDARVKFDFKLATGKPYVGARLVFPFGD